MDLDITVQKGRSGQPVIILIHGLGMDKNIWLAPLQTKIFAKNIPLRIFTAIKPSPSLVAKRKKLSLGEPLKEIWHLWKALKGEGFNLVCWSQRRPVGPMRFAVEELTWVIERVKKLFPENPISLIGHSRGGLIARKFMEKRRPEVKAFITISTPHAGSEIATLGKYLKPVSVFLKGMFPRDTHSKISETIKNVAHLLEGNALRELLPDSSFYKKLRDKKQKGIDYVSFGGTQPRLLTLYVWKKKENILYPRTLLSIPDSLVKIFPSFLAVDEVVPGKGDGLVSAQSSFLPYAPRHVTVPVNHLSILWNKKVIQSIIKSVGGI
jgi:pimeloyl-ACP methyl ester carboxylesterase